ncbi:choice-of-anchor Q domain-containing protein [Candidatus Margulisiibacteriota bacterium]
MKNRSYYIGIALLVLSTMMFIVMTGVAGTSASERSSANYTIEADVLSGSGTVSATSSGYETKGAVAGEAVETGSGESDSYAVYGGYSESSGLNPDDPTSLQQYMPDGTTVIATGEWVETDTVVFKFTMSDPDGTGFLMPQVEVRITDDAFTDTPNYSGTEVAYSGTPVTGVVTVSSISADLAYHWQARIIDDEGRTSGYISFGANAESATDFGISADATAPDVTVLSPDGDEYWEINTTHDITWIATDEISSVDHVNIYYSTNEGASWTTIATNETDDGIYSGWIPSIPENRYLISVEAVDTLNNTGSDRSDSTFTFYEIGNAYGCTLWNKMGSDGEVQTSEIGEDGSWGGSSTYVTAEYDDGAYSNNTANYISFSGVDLTPNLFVWEAWFKTDWSMTNGVASDSGQHVFFYWKYDATNRIYAQYYHGETLIFGSQIAGTYYDARFTTGINWGANELHHIAFVWDRTDANERRIYLDGGEILPTAFIGSDTPASLGVTGGTLYALRWDTAARSFAGTIDNFKMWSFAKTDFSDRFYEGFETNYPTVEVLTPSSTGIVIEPSTTYEVTWTATDESGITNIAIRYSSGEAWIDIATTETDDGSYIWTAPAFESDTMLISIEATDTTGLKSYDQSDNYFKIRGLADDIWVSTTGSNDAGDGTVGDPYETIDYGMTRVRAGGTVHVFGGTYNEYDIDWSDQDGVTLIASSTASPVTIDAQRNGRGISLEVGVNLTIESITIQNAAIGEGAGGGAGIYLSPGSNLWLDDVEIKWCSVEGVPDLPSGDYDGIGSAIFALGATIVAQDCSIEANNAESGTCAYGTWTITRSAISNNIGDAAAVAFAGSWEAFDCIFDSNYGSSSGGVFYGYTYGGTMEATNCVFSNNSTGWDGGVIYGVDFTGTNCTFYNNSAYMGGGVFYVGTANITNSIFYNNFAVTAGGGIAWGVNWTGINNTYYSNTAEARGGVFVDGYYTETNSIFSGNYSSSGPVASNEGGSWTTDITYSDIQSDGWETGTGNTSAEPSFVSTNEGDTATFLRLDADSACIDTGTTEGAPSNDKDGNTRPTGFGIDMGAYEFQGASVRVDDPDGGETAYTFQNYEILWTTDPTADQVNIRLSTNEGATWDTLITSGATDTGTYTWNVSNGLISTECLISVEALEIGFWTSDVSDAKFEIAGKLTVYVATTGDDGAGDGSVDAPYLTIQKGLDEVIAGGTVEVFGGTYNEYDITWPNTDGITLKASTETSVCTIDAQDNGRVIHITQEISATIEGFTITNGSVTGYGGGICIDKAAYDGNEDIFISDCIFTGNYANDNVIYFGGGGIYARGYNLWLTNCIFKDNTTNYAAGDGPGALMYDGSEHSGWTSIGGQCVITNCLFWKNIGGWGGAMWAWYHNAITVESCTFVSNEAAYNDAASDGGAIGNDAVTANRSFVRNCIFWNNTCYDQGQQIYEETADSTAIQVTYSDIQGGASGVSSAVSLGTGTIEADPLFASTTDGDPDFLNLGPGSPCIDKGTETGAPSTDLAGNSVPRGIGVDMGAYEFQGPSVRVDSPNGGESYDGGDDITITWTATDEVYSIASNSIDIRYSNDNGSTWNWIISNEANTGIHTWEAPSTPSDQYLISIEVTNDNSEWNYDISDNNFLILIKTVYVATDGNDSTGDGSVGNPYLTIAKGLTAVAAGGTVEVFGGTYNENDIEWPDRSNITLKASAETSLVTIDAQYLGRAISVESAVNVSIEAITIQNGMLTLFGAGGGIYLATGSNLWLEDVIIKNCTVEGYGGGVYAVHVDTNVYATRCKFIGNEAHNPPSGYPPGGQYGLGGAGNYGTWTVVNCIFSNNYAEYGGVFEGWSTYSGSRSDFTSTNCTYFYNTADYGRVTEYPQSWTGVNDIYWDNYPNSDLFNNVVSRTNTYSDIQTGGWIAGTGNISAEPVFVTTDEASADFLHIDSSSPVIDQGTATGAPSDDYDGNPRPNGGGYDMGAFEFQGTIVTVDDPNGGENLMPGESYEILWTTTPEADTDSINIRLSIDNGLTWDTLITSGVADVGVYTWEVTENLSTECLISIEASKNSIWSSDTSDATFTIGSLEVYLSTTGSDDAGDGTPGSPYQTIQNALNGVLPGGTVYVAGGTYTGTGNVNLTWPDRDGITLKASLETSVVTIDAEDTASTRIISVESAVQLTIEAITLTNGNFNPGGIIWLAPSSTVSLISVEVTSSQYWVIRAGDNTANIYAKDSTFDSNNRVAYYGNWEVANCIFSNNTGGDGGVAQYCDSWTVTDSTFTDNYAVNGSVFYQVNPVTIDNCTFEGNGVQQQGGVAFGGTIYVANSTFNNSYNGSYDGGVANGGTWVATNCAFSNSYTPRYGGVFYGGNRTLYNCSFSNNSILYGDGSVLSASYTSATMNAVNCIFWGTDDPFAATGGSISGTISYCDVQNEDWSYFTTIECISQDPEFESPATNDLKLIAGSPCINTGTDEGGGIPSEDIEGTPRPQGAGIDMGCYEQDTGISLLDIVYVSTTGNDTTGTGTNSANAYRTVQKGMTRVSAEGLVSVEAGSYQESGVTWGDVGWPARNGITLRGASNGLTTIDAQTTDRAIDVFNPVTLTIESITIKDGQTGGFNNGAGVRLASGSNLKLIKVIFYSNYAWGGASYGEGGAVYAAGSTVAAENCIFDTNTARYEGGAIHGGTLDIKNCTFINNTVVSGFGTSISSGEITATNTIFWGNDDQFNGTISGTLNNCDVQGNDWDGMTSTECIASDPLFISETFGIAGFAELVGWSPCVDSGTASGAPSEDWAGNTRPYGFDYDMGAYEFQGPSIIVIQPNGGEQITTEAIYDVTWNISPEASNVVVRLSTNEGSTWDTTLTTEAWTHSGVGTYEWTPDASLVSTECLISVEVIGNSIWNYDVSNATFEIVAAEMPFTSEVYVATTGSNDTGDGTPDNPYETIAFGLTRVATSGTVYVFGGTYNEYDIIWPTFGEITLKASLETSAVTIDAESNGRIISVESTVSLTLESITLQNGYLSGDTGGGIKLAEGSTLLLLNTTIQYCTAETTGSAAGGAVYSLNSTVNAQNSRLTGNNAGSGWGGAVYAGDWNAINCVFSYNRANDGGVVAGYADGRSGTWTVTNCAFAYNYDANSGIIAIGLVRWTSVNCSYYGNNTPSSTYGLIDYMDYFTSINSIYWGNTWNGSGPMFTRLDNISVNYSDMEPDQFYAGTGNISIEPRFVSTTDTDDDFLRLDAGSSCIDTGTSEGAPSVDIDGNSRPYGFGFDMGISEFQGPSIRVDDPNGGESYYPKDDVTITWRATDEVYAITGDVITVNYSSDGGATWNTITTEAYTGITGIYTWEAPSTISANYLISVEVTNSNSEWNYDVSDASFEVLASSEVWVSTTGSNTTGAGTVDEPWETIGFGVNRVAAGGTVQVFGGTYNEYDITWPDVDWITLKASVETSPATIDAESNGRIINQPNAISITIEGMTLQNAYLTGAGGAIYMPSNDATLWIANVIFQDNTVVGEGSNGCGSAINNSVGVTAGTAKMYISNSTFKNGSASSNGGVIYGGIIELVNTKFTGNYGGLWGGVITSATVEATNCVFADNTGAPLYSSISHNCFWSMTNCVFYNNSGSKYLFYSNLSWDARNTIFWGNTFSVGICYDNWSGNTNCDIQPDVTRLTGTNNISIEPQFTSTTSTDVDYLKLGPGSPCIDTGTTESAPSDDIDGNTRPRGLGVDMGPFEFQGPSVKVDSPNGGESYYPKDDVTITWRATDEVYAITGDVITVNYSSDGGATWNAITTEAYTGITGIYTWEAPSTISANYLISVEVTNSNSEWNYDVSNASFEVLASSEVWVSTTGSNTTGAGTVDNPWETINFGVNRVAAGGTVQVFGGTYNEYDITWPDVDWITLKASIETSLVTIDAQSNSRIISIESTVNVTLESITLQNGKILGPGAGIYISASSVSLWLDSVTIKTCTVESPPTYTGGAIYANGNNNIYAQDSTFDGNSARMGGVSDRGIWTVDNCVFTNNSSSWYSGVAEYGIWYVTNSIFHNNTALWGGVSRYGTFVATNCAFSYNSATNGEGGVAYAWDQGTWTADNCIFWGNTSNTSYKVIRQITTPNVQYSDIQSDDWIAGTGNISSEPNFVSTDEANSEFLHLGGGSPCIDTGTTEGAPSDDFDGNSRPHGLGVDMGPFEFQGSSVRINDPNGGETFYPYDIFVISWEVDPAITGFTIRLSTNEGATWDTLITSETVSKTGICTYEWTVPELTSTECLISIEVIGNSLWNSDVSDSKFEIGTAPPEVYVSPTGNDTTGNGTIATPYLTFQKGLDRVAAGGDVFAMQGTHTLPTSEFTSDTMIYWPAKDNITLKLSPEASAPATIDAESRGRVIYIGSSLNVTIEGITLTNGLATVNGNGGAIDTSTYVNLWLTTVEVTNCTADTGATGRGGAIHGPDFTTSVYMIDSTVSGNYARGFGGAIYYCNLTAENCTFKNNSSGQGGVSYSFQCIQEYDKCKFIGNYATGSGGVFKITTAYIQNSVFEDNYSASGGIDNDSTIVATNCAFSRNYATSAGTIQYEGTWTSMNCIYWDNYDESYFNSNTYDVTYSDIEPADFVAGTGNISSEPLWISTIEGDSEYYHIAGGSPCIDTATSEGAPSEDMEGNVRPRGFGYDMGPFEFQGPSIRVDDPNGGETLAAGDIFDILWTTSPDADSITIRLSTNEGASWDTLITSEIADSGTYSWEVPSGIISGECLISIEAVIGSDWNYDISDAVFTIKEEPTIILLTPADDEGLTMGGTFDITWSATPDAAVDYINIRYSTGDAFAWIEVVTGEANDGSYTWNVPDLRSVTCKVSVESVGYFDDSDYDANDGYFLIGSSEVYISTTGDDDTGDGTVDNPFATLQTGADWCAADGSVLAFGGSYTGTDNKEVTWPKRSGITLQPTNESSSVTFYGENSGKLITTEAAVQITIESITVNDYNADTCIHLVGGSVLNLESCSFTNNVHGANGRGGVVRFDYGYVYANDCTFTDNDVNGNTGCGVFLGGTWEATNCTFTSNSGGAYVFGVGSGDNVTVTNCTFTENYGAYAGTLGGTIVVIDSCTFEGNTSAYTGAVGKDSTFYVTDSIFINNRATNRGGVFATSTVVATNSAFVLNWTNSEGGVFYRCYTKLYNCSFNGNTANGVGAVASVLGANYTFDAVNCIFWGDDDDLFEVNAGYGSFTNCDVYNEDWSGLTTIECISSDPIFMNGYSADMKMGAGSPCINTGTSEGAPSTDIAGTARPQPGGNTNFDMGCFEQSSGIPLLDIVYVSATSGDDATGDGSSGNPFATVQKGLNYCSAEGLVSVEAGEYLEYEISWPGRDNITIRGASTGLTTIDAEDNDRAFDIHTPLSLTIEAVTVKDGYVKNSVRENGGGIRLISGSNLQLFKVIFESNYAISPYDFEGVGGAVYSGGSTVYAENCIFDSNGVAWKGGVAYGGTWEVVNCTFYDNTAYSTRTGDIAYGVDWTAVNCIFWASSSWYNDPFDAMTGGSFTNCDEKLGDWGGLTTTECITDDPQFISTTYGNDGFLELPGWSPCVDAGTSEGAPSDDIDENSRPRGFGDDMGAYEYQGSSVKVNYPDGGETLEPYSTYEISWEVEPEITEYTIRLSTNEGATWDTVLTSETVSKSGICTYEWTLDETLVSTECLISIEVTGNSIWNYDVSNSKFEIGVAPTEVYVSPTGSDEAGNGTIANPYLTFQKALDKVAIGGSVMAMEGVHTLATSEFVNSSMINWPDKDNITLQLSPEASNPATIDAESRGRIIYVGNAVNVSVEGITLTNAYITTAHGGAFNLVSGVNLWLTTVEVDSCKAWGKNGSVIYAASSSTNYIYAVDSNFTGNSGSTGGSAGSVLYNGNITADNCTFKGSVAYHGAVIYSTGTQRFNNCRFISNFGNHSGGVFKGDQTIYVQNSVFDYNIGGLAGGVFMGGTATVTNCAFFKNRSASGTVMSSGTMTSINSIFWDNYTNAYFSSSTLDITYSDIDPNNFEAGTGNISIEPTWASTTEGDPDYCHLAPGSPCIDSGTMESGIPVLDAAGNARPHNWYADMGPYEFQGASVAVLAPNGGETFITGQDMTITWTATDEDGLETSPLPITIRYSTNNGSSWTLVTAEVAHTGIYTWEVPAVSSSQYLISVEAMNASGFLGSDKSDAVFTVTGDLFPPTNVTAEALPEDAPTYVQIYWAATTAEAIEGYYIYRGLTTETYDATPLNDGSPTTELTYIDSTVSAGIDYYYAVTAYGWSVSGPYSNETSAPEMELTRTATVDAPISGGYSGGAHDAVPGATIKYTIKYENIGFAPARVVVINDKIPQYTEYLVDSATGEAATAVRFSDDDGATYGYTPSGIVDAAVTHVSWEVEDVYSGGAKLCTFEVVIK